MYSILSDQLCRLSLTNRKRARKLYKESIWSETTQKEQEDRLNQPNGQKEKQLMFAKINLFYLGFLLELPHKYVNEIK